MHYETIQFILELVGSVSFAISGALLGIRRSMDIFGTIVLGVVTAVGGGMIRDIALGITPPMAFTDSRLTLISFLVSVFVFWIFYRRGDHLNGRFLITFEKYLVIFDAVGLGAFTIVGMNTAAATGYMDHRFLILFCGMVTGIGGGIIRDLLAGIIPFVFIRQIYAVASFLGGLLYLLTYQSLGPSFAMILGFVGVIFVRLFSYSRNWNLPRIMVEEVEERRDKRDE